MICWVLGSVGLLAVVCACVLAVHRHGFRVRAVAADGAGLHARGDAAQRARAGAGLTERRREAMKTAVSHVPALELGGVRVGSLAEARLAGEWNVQFPDGTILLVVSGRRVDDVFVIAERVRQGAPVTAFAAQERGRPGLLLLAPDASAWLNVEDVRVAGQAEDDQALMRKDFR